MDYKLELVCVPVTDVDAAKEFYVEQAGFVADHDQRVNDGLRFVQLTPPGSGCSICLGEGLTTMVPGSLEGLQLVVADADLARAEFLAARHGGRRGRGTALGAFRVLRRPGRQQVERPAGHRAHLGVNSGVTTGTG